MADLRQIRRYLDSKNPAAADRMVTAILATAENLALFPMIGRQQEGTNVRLLQVPGIYYLLPYRIRPDCIEILAVFDERRNWPDLFE